jgi:hypothetical protein
MLKMENNIIFQNLTFNELKMKKNIYFIKIWMKK